MNYYPRYPGDYLIKTVDLTMIEDGAYTRLLDWYYSNERPIPHVKRYEVARATTPAARSAVDVVLVGFFIRDGEVWRHGRVDEELAKAAPRIEAAKLNGSKGGRKPKGGGSTNPLGNPRKNPPGNPAGTQWGTQQPSSLEPAPDLEKKTEQRAEFREREPDDLGNTGEAAAEHDVEPTSAGLACRAMREAGIAAVNPGNLALRELLRQGATVDEFRALAVEAMRKQPPLGNPFGWVLKVLPARRSDAAAIRLAPPAAATVPSTDADRTRTLLDADAEHRRIVEAQRQARLANRKREAA